MKQKTYTNLPLSILVEKNLMSLTEEAKKKSLLLLEEQGISAIALALSRVLVEFIQQPGKMRL